MKIAALFFVLISLNACQPTAKHEQGVSKVQSHHTAEEAEGEGIPVPERVVVDGEKLVTKISSVSEQTIQSHYSIKISVKADNQADHLQFVICGLANSEICNPSLTAPGEFSEEEHVFPDPPAGEVKVMVRSCVRPQNAVDAARLCGRWDEHVYLQKENSKDELGMSLVALYEHEKQFREKCRQAKTLVDGELGSRVFSSKEEKEFEALLRNFSSLGEDACAELVKNGFLEDVTDRINSDKKLALAGEQEQRGWGYAVLGLGVVGMIVAATKSKSLSNKIAGLKEAITDFRLSRVASEIEFNAKRIRVSELVSEYRGLVQNIERLNVESGRMNLQTLTGDWYEIRAAKGGPTMSDGAFRNQFHLTRANVNGIQLPQSF